MRSQRLPHPAQAQAAFDLLVPSGAQGRLTATNFPPPPGNILIIKAHNLDLSLFYSPQLLHLRAQREQPIAFAPRRFAFTAAAPRSARSPRTNRAANVCRARQTPLGAAAPSPAPGFARVTLNSPPSRGAAPLNRAPGRATPYRVPCPAPPRHLSAAAAAARGASGRRRPGSALTCAALR